VWNFNSIINDSINFFIKTLFMDQRKLCDLKSMPKHNSVTLKIVWKCFIFWKYHHQLSNDNLCYDLVGDFWHQTLPIFFWQVKMNLKIMFVSLSKWIVITFQRLSISKIKMTFCFLTWLLFFLFCFIYSPWIFIF